MEPANDQDSPDRPDKPEAEAGASAEQRPTLEPRPEDLAEPELPPDSTADQAEQSQDEGALRQDATQPNVVPTAETTPAPETSPADPPAAAEADQDRVTPPASPTAPSDESLEELKPDDADGCNQEEPGAVPLAETVESEADSLVEATSAAEPARAEPPEPQAQPAAPAEAAIEPPSVSPESEPPSTGQDAAATSAALDQQRAELVDLLFGDDRPRTAAVQQMAAAYNESLCEASRADRTVSGEAEWLAAEARRRHEAVLEPERETFSQAVVKIQQAIDQHETFFQRLSALVDELAGEVARLDENDPRLQTAPDELRVRLANYRKGIEIIHRMFSRVADRKKPLSPTPPAVLSEQLEPPASPFELQEITAFAERLCRTYHDLRDANYHAVADANKHAGDCRQAILAAAQQLVSAVDGIDSGLANQSETRASLEELHEDGSMAELLDEWLAAYTRVDEHVRRFFGDVGIEAHTVQRGTRFDPETMEPQAAVSNPELNNEDVAAVIRRGFSLQGQQIRPMIVDVVRNG